MKKIKYLLITLLLLIPITGKAAIYHCSVSSGQVVSGQNFTVKFYGSLSSSSATWSGTIFSEGNARYVSGGTSIWHDGASFSQTVTYNAGNPGTARFYVGNIDVSDENQEYSGSDSCTVTIVAANSSNSSSKKNNNNNNKSNNNSNKSNNNNLRKIYIDGVELTPEFDKDTLEYSAIVEGDKDKITIETESEDGKASIEGDGEKELAEGLNEIVISVHAENGDVKEYKLNITRKELNPIEVTIGNKKYTVVKKETEMEVPEGFEKITITIDENEVVAYSSEYISNVLVVLVDEEGNTDFYLYDQKKDYYSKFVEFKTKEIKLMIFDAKEEKPFGYKPISFTIEGKKVNGYYYKQKDKFRLVYAVNMENGDEGFYQYDMDQKTFQRFYGTQVEDYVKDFKIFVLGALGGILLILILFISVISLASKNRKLKKGKKIVKEEVKEEPKKVVDKYSLEEDEGEKEEVDKRFLRKEQKRLKKEAKLKAKEEKSVKNKESKRLKEEADNFLK